MVQQGRRFGAGQGGHGERCAGGGLMRGAPHRLAAGTRARHQRGALASRQGHRPHYRRQPIAQAGDQAEGGLFTAVRQGGGQALTFSAAEAPSVGCLCQFRLGLSGCGFAIPAGGAADSHQRGRD
eukprot:2522146-Pleurochrysis_carterae.AAC.2